MKVKITLRELVESYSSDGDSATMYLCHFIREMLGMDDEQPVQVITAELKRVVSEHFKLRSDHNLNGTLTGWIINDIGDTEEEYIVTTITGMNIKIEDPYDQGYKFRRWVLWFLYGAAPETVFSFEL